MTKRQRPIRWCALALCLLLAALARPGHATAEGATAGATQTAWLPLIGGDTGCLPIPAESYATLPMNPPPTDRPAALHADLNLALRGYAPALTFLGLVDYGGHADPDAPQLPSLFADGRTPMFVASYRVYDWDWACNCRGAPIGYPDVTLLGMRTTPGETIHVPDSGRTVGSGYEAFVLYAGAERITLKYTREDNVVLGYTIHLEGVCVEPRLLALYQMWDAAGRGQLPVLRAGQTIGRARGSEIRVAIRDAGSFLDPRSRKDWWQGR